MTISNFSNCLLTSYNFLDEYDHFFISPEVEIQQHIINLKKIMQPAAQEIRQWKDLVKFRNHVIAHNFRDRMDAFQSLFIDGRLSKYKIPQTTADISILVRCISLIAETVQHHFKTEYQNFKKYAEASTFVRVPDFSIAGQTSDYFNNINQKIQTELSSFGTHTT